MSASASDVATNGVAESPSELDVLILGDGFCGKSWLAAQLIAQSDESLNGRRPRVELVPVVGFDGCLSGPAAHAELSGRRCSLLEVPGDSTTLKGLAGRAFPGHCEVALLVSSAALGENERALSNDGSLREHALLGRVLGAKRFILAVTKMDVCEKPYSQARFEEVRDAAKEILRELGVVDDIPCVPVSGAVGDNVLSSSVNMAWYNGPTLSQVLGSIHYIEANVTSSLRASVREVYHLESVGAVAAGRVEQGILRVGAEVKFAPGGAKGTVKLLEAEGRSVEVAYARDNVSFAVEGVGLEDLRRGMVASDASKPAFEAETFLAHVFVLRGPGEMRVGFSPVLVCHSVRASCRVEALLKRLDRRSGEELEDRPSALRAGDVGLVRFRPEQPLCVEPHESCPELGRFASDREQTAIALVGVVREVQPRFLLTDRGTSAADVDNVQVST